MMKALVLAGGFPQIALLEELRSRHIETVLADYYPEPVAKSHADKFYQVSTLDIEAITDVAQKEKVDFLITACTDQALMTVAHVSEKLGLPCYIDEQTARNVTNKEYMKKVFMENHVPTAQYVITGKVLEEKPTGLEYPLIVKPVDCNSSKGVKKVLNDSELRETLTDAIHLSRTNTAIVEEFVDGSELTVDVYVESGTAHVLSVSDSDKIAEADKFVIFRTRYPAAGLNDELKNKISETAQKIADGFGLKDSPMLIQMITDGRRISVLEFSARTGGGVKYLLIKKASGFDVISAVVDLTLGEKPHVSLCAPENKYISNEFIYCRPGIFDRLDGFEELKVEGIISDYYLFKWRGATFDKVENSGDRIAGFTIQADTPEEMRRKHQTAVRRIRVLDPDGNDLMRHDLLTDWH